jgi:hypothetical protein
LLSILVTPRYENKITIRRKGKYQAARYADVTLYDTWARRRRRRKRKRTRKKRKEKQQQVLTPNIVKLQYQFPTE